MGNWYFPPLEKKLCSPTGAEGSHLILPDDLCLLTLSAPSQFSSDKRKVFLGNFIATVYYRVKGENLRLVFVVKIHGSPFTREILLDS